MTFKNIILGLGFVAASIAPCFAHGGPHKDQTAQARYIANEGVLILQGETKIMFDPLPLSGFGTYPEVPEATFQAIMDGTGVYAGIDAVFISHAHTDHFSPENMINYMKAHKKVKLVAPQQALESLQKHELWSKKLLKRIKVIDLEAGDAPQNIRLRNIRATAVHIPHAGWPAPARASIQNIVYRVTLDKSATVMHMGDADPNPVHFTPHADHWAAKTTDTAFPPYWFFLSEDGQNILSNDINAVDAIGIHVPIKVPQELRDSGADFLSKFEETRVIGSEKK
ncbi:MAG: MBL fold metallo-hydrolase [Litorimonas sp.]